MEAQAAFLGPNLWDKTLPYDTDLKVTQVSIPCKEEQTRNYKKPNSIETREKKYEKIFAHEKNVEKLHQSNNNKNMRKFKIN